MSRDLFDMSWRERIDAAHAAAVLVTGCSCCARIKPFTVPQKRHPAGDVPQHLSAAGHAPC